jgi:predicted nucleotidyltransferase
VRVFSIDREAVVKDLRNAIEALAASRPEIVKVVLFGSFVRDDFGPGSDADLLIILDSSSKPIRERIPDYVALHAGVPVDVFPYTQAELETRRAAGDSFIENAMTRGLVLFERAGGR